MPQELELAYVGIEIPEPAILTPFLHETVGLAPGEPVGRPGTTAWRNDAKAHRVLVGQGPRNDASFVGIEVPDCEVLAELRARLNAAGYDATDATDEECAARRVEQLVHTIAPWGVRLELVCGLAVAATPFESPLVPGGFLTERAGFGHAVFATTALDDTHRFVVDILGFEQSDWLETELAPGVALEVRFYHCNTRHHSLAFARTPFELPQKLHHLMFETNSRDDVGTAFDRAWASGRSIPNGLGRHDNDGMFSFYVASPAGFLVEIGHGARTIDRPWVGNRRYERISAWGHQPLRVA